VTISAKSKSQLARVATNLAIGVVGLLIVRVIASALPMFHDAGWMVKDKGSWSITEEGRSAFARLKDPEEFQREAGRLYREWAGRQPPEEEDETVPEGASIEATTTLEEAEEEAWRSIENYIPTLNPYDFQKLVAALLRGMGYHVAWVAPPGADRGVDILAYNDPLGTKMPRIKVQVKRRQDKIPVEEIR